MTGSQTPVARFGMGNAVDDGCEPFLRSFEVNQWGVESHSMTAKCRVSLDFASYPDSDLAGFAANVAKSLEKNPLFPNPPVAAPDLGRLQGSLSTALHAAMQGGLQLTAAKNHARRVLLDALRDDAHYVQSVNNNNMQALLSSGFHACSTTRSRGPLDKTSITRIENAASTQLLVRLTPVRNAKTYQLQISVDGDGGWREVGAYTQARRIVVERLTPGTTYTLRARAIGGTTGCSDWCDPVSRMAT